MQQLIKQSLPYHKTSLFLFLLQTHFSREQISTTHRISVVYPHSYQCLFLPNLTLKPIFFCRCLIHHHLIYYILQSSASHSFPWLYKSIYISNQAHSLTHSLTLRYSTSHHQLLDNHMQGVVLCCVVVMTREQSM